MTDKFICFYDSGVTGDEQKDRVPIAIGRTRDEAMENSLPRSLEIAGQRGTLEMHYSSVAVVAQPQLSEDEFLSIGKICDETFAKKETA